LLEPTQFFTTQVFIHFSCLCLWRAARDIGSKDYAEGIGGRRTVLTV